MIAFVPPAQSLVPSMVVLVVLCFPEARVVALVAPSPEPEASFSVPESLF